MVLHTIASILVTFPINSVMGGHSGHPSTQGWHRGTYPSSRLLDTLEWGGRQPGQRILNSGSTSMQGQACVKAGEKPRACKGESGVHPINHSHSDPTHPITSSLYPRDTQSHPGFPTQSHLLCTLRMFNHSPTISGTPNHIHASTPSPL